ncbi:MAG: cell division protein SepF [Cyanobacteria bacterium J06641_5]
MSTVFNKLKDFVGFNEQQEDYDNYYEQGEEMEGNDYATTSYYADDNAASTSGAEDERSSRRRARVAAATMSTPDRELSRPSSRERFGSTGMGNVIGLPSAQPGLFEVVVIEPRSFEKMPQVIQALRDRKSVVLNLTAMDPDEAQRAVDFVAGGTYAIDGHQERVGESIFLFTPNCVQVTTQAGVTHEVGSYVKEQAATQNAAPAPAWDLDETSESIAQ